MARMLIGWSRAIVPKTSGAGVRSSGERGVGVGDALKIEDFFNQTNILDLSFFNFRNAITAAYFANDRLQIQRVNDNFKAFFPILGNVTNVYFPDVLEQIGLPGARIDAFVKDIQNKGTVLIPEIVIQVDGEERVFSLLSTRTTDADFSHLNGVQGQFVDRTSEVRLRQEREELTARLLEDQVIIEGKTRQLQDLANRLAKYLSPQVYQSLFESDQTDDHGHQRRNLTVFFSDIEGFTDLTEMVAPERLARLVNSFLSEMTTIAIDSGGTIDKFIGDSIMVFFGDPETSGEVEDALKCVEMALRMQARVAELKEHWLRLGMPRELKVRMGIATGFCTVGNFGSDQRLDYTALGRPVNLAARLQSLAPPNGIVAAESTVRLIEHEVECSSFIDIAPKGFKRPVKAYSIGDFKSSEHRERRPLFSHIGKRVSVTLTDTSDVEAAIAELRGVQEEIQRRLTRSDTGPER